MSCDRAPSFLGAYLLGALDPAERRAADAHLARCPDCAAELAEFRGLTAQLDRVPADEVAAEPVTPSPELFGRVAAAVQRPARRRWLAAAAAAAVLAAAGGTWAALREDGGLHTATSGGVRLSVAAEEGGDGSMLDVTIEGLPPEMECSLVVVDDGGARHLAGDWPSYGGEASYRLWSPVPPADVADVVLEADGSEVVRVRFGD